MRPPSAILAFATLFNLSSHVNEATAFVLQGRTTTVNSSPKPHTSTNTNTIAVPSITSSGENPTKENTENTQDSCSCAMTGDNVSAAMLAANRELDDFGLVRSSRGTIQNPGAFANFVITKNKDWEQYSIDPKDDTKSLYGNKAVYQYQTIMVQPGSGVFNTIWVETENRGLPDHVNRRTLTKNGWTAAGGDLGKLMILGDSNIINPAVRNSIHDALTEHPRGRDAGDGPQKLVFREGDKGWEELRNNPFIGGYEKMLLEDAAAFKNARIAAITVIIDIIEQYHLQVSLTRQKHEAPSSSDDEDAPDAKRPNTSGGTKATKRKTAPKRNRRSTAPKRTKSKRSPIPGRDS